MMDDPSDWKVEELKKELRERGAKVTGRKEELYERLLGYRRNDNFSAGPTIPLPSAVMPDFPPTASFQSMTSSQSHRVAVPPITKSHVHEFLSKYLVKDANLPTSLAMKKAEKIVAENVMAASFSVAKTDDDACFFLTGIVKKSYKKFSYNVRIAINIDASIKASQCECPVGIGPNAACKHVLGMMLMLSHFVKTGELLVQLSCTEQLQSFNRPSKKYEGPPVKIQKLGKGAPDYDPRPERFRNMENYSDHIYNETINYCANSQKDITMKYAIPNKYTASKTAIIHDHHYVGCLDKV